MATMGKSPKKAHPTPPKTPNHRDYVRDVSPEMAAEYDAPLMRGVACTDSPGQSRVHVTGTHAPARSEY